MFSTSRLIEWDNGARWVLQEKYPEHVHITNGSRLIEGDNGITWASLWFQKPTYLQMISDFPVAQ